MPNVQLRRCTNQRQRVPKSGRESRRRKLEFEALEDRLVPSQVQWINPDGGDWNTAANWSSGSVPGSDDDVVINTASAATIGYGNFGSVHSLTTAANDTLSIVSGSLGVTSSSTLSGPLSMTGGVLSASGAGTTLLANGATTASDASLGAEAGATFSLPNLTTYTESGTSAFESFVATGTGSQLNLPALTTIGTLEYEWYVNASDGGSVNLPGLATISEYYGSIVFYAVGSGSTLNLSALTSFHTAGGVSSQLELSSGATMLASNLTNFDGVEIFLDGTATVPLNQWRSITNGDLSVKGGTYTLPNLIDVDGSGLTAQDGGILALPKLTTDNNTRGLFEAMGVNSTLDLSALTTLGSMTSSWQVEALGGGTVNLSGLTTIDEPSIRVQLAAYGSSSELNLSALTSFTGANLSNFAVTNSATVLANNLTTFSGVQITLDGTGTVAISQWQTITSGSLTVTGGSYTLAGLTDVNGSSLLAQSGGALGLPNLTTDADTHNSTFEATGPNSTLDLSALTTLGSMADFWHVNALAGGTVNLSGLATINEPSDGVQITADGSGSKLNLSALSSFSALSNFRGPGNSTFVVTRSATVLANSLTTFSGVQITLDGTGTVSTSQWSTIIRSGSLTVTGGSYALAGLSNVNGSSLSAQNGASLALPQLTAYADVLGDTQTNSSTFEATGVNSALDLSALTILQSLLKSWTAAALAGGMVNLSGLATIDEPASLGVQLNADGSGSKLDLSALSSFSAPGSYIGAGNAVFAVTNSATVLANSLTTFSGVQITLDGTGTVATGQWSAITSGASLFVTGGSYTFPGLTDLNGSSLTAFRGAALTLPNLITYAQTGFTFFLAEGVNSTLNLSALTTLGSMTGTWQAEVSGGGTVNLSGLTTVNEPNAVVRFTADGAGSTLNLSPLTSFTGASLSKFVVTNSATVLASSLTNFNNVDITLDGTNTQVANSWTTLIGGSLTLTRGLLTLQKLTSIQGSNITVSGGATLTVPAVASYAGGVAVTTILEATGPGSSLAMPNLVSLTVKSKSGSVVQIEALAGATVNLQGLTHVSGGPLALISDGSGSVLDVSHLTHFNSTGGTVSATHNGIIKIPVPRPLPILSPPAQLGATANGITYSTEHYTQFVTNAYQTYLGRAPDLASLNSWVGAMQHGLTDEQLEAGFIGSAEYIANHGGKGAGWVRGMYQDILGRTPSQSEVDGWVQALNSGVAPQDVAYGFASGAEREGNRVRADYQTFLGRTPTQPEVAGWVNGFLHGLTNEGLVAGFLSSPEYYNSAAKGKGDNLGWIQVATQDELQRPATAAEINAALAALTPMNLTAVANLITHATDHYRQFVTNAYQTYLGRAPDLVSLNSWVSAMQHGLTDEQLEAGFIGSAEYIANHGGKGAGWVRGLYQDILGRTPSQPEVDGWVQVLNSGVSPQSVALGFAAGAEREGNRVRADYQTFLGRTPTQPEVDGWVNGFLHGLTNENLVAGFLGSIEYFNSAAKGNTDKTDWVLSAVLDELQRLPSADEFNTWGSMLQ